MASAYAVAAEGIVTIFNAEFDAEDFTLLHDKLHESLGRERTEIGISPIDQAPSPRNALVLETRILIQFYDLWVQEIDPETQVDPRLIAEKAERLWKALERNQASGNSQVWYYSVDNVTYPDDPTGNRTRFHMTVRARGDNTGLVERL